MKIEPILNLRSLFVKSACFYWVPMEACCLYFLFYLHHSCLYLGLQYTTVKGDPQGTLENLSHLVHVPVNRMLSGTLKREKVKMAHLTRDFTKSGKFEEVTEKGTHLFNK